MESSTKVDHGADHALVEIKAHIADAERGPGSMLSEVSFASWPMRRRLFGSPVGENGQVRGEVECAGQLLRAWIVTRMDDDTIKVFKPKSEPRYIAVAPEGLTATQCETYTQLRREGLSIPATLTVVRALEIEGGT